MTAGEPVVPRDAAPIHVLLATCNGERYLPALLDSLLAQTDQDWRLIARDDASTDATPDLLRRLAARDCRVTLIEDSRGRVGIRDNFAILMTYARDAGAPYFALCDQDDVWRPEKLARLRAALDEAGKGQVQDHPLLAYSDLTWIDAAGRAIAPSHFRRAGAARVLDGVGPWLLAHNLIPGCATMGNRALLLRALPLPPQAVHHDWWVVLAAAAAGSVIPVAEPLIDYRQHKGNAIGASSPARRIGAFARNLRQRMRAAGRGHAQALEQAEALQNYIEANGGRPEWMWWSRAFCNGLGASCRWRRIWSAVRGPVRRVGVVRNCLLLVLAASDQGRNTGRAH